jgi:DNA invertase Pin-like site-specific DNA recombinase
MEAGSADYMVEVEKLKAAGCERIFSDSGDWIPVGIRTRNNARPPELAKLMRALQPGDVLTVPQLERLAPREGDRVDIFDELDLRRCEFVSLEGEIESLWWRDKAIIRRISPIS